MPKRTREGRLQVRIARGEVGSAFAHVQRVTAAARAAQSLAAAAEAAAVTMTATLTDAPAACHETCAHIQYLLGRLSTAAAALGEATAAAATATGRAEAATAAAAASAGPRTASLMVLPDCALERVFLHLERTEAGLGAGGAPGGSFPEAKLPRTFPCAATAALASTCRRMRAFYREEFVRELAIHAQLRTAQGQVAYRARLSGALARFCRVDGIVIYDADRIDHAIALWQASPPSGAAANGQSPGAVAAAVKCAETATSLSDELLRGADANRASRIKRLSFRTSGLGRKEDAALESALWNGRGIYLADSAHWFFRFRAAECVAGGSWVYGKVSPLTPGLHRDVLTEAKSLFQLLMATSGHRALRSLEFANRDVIDRVEYGNPLNWAQLAAFTELESLKLSHCREHKLHSGGGSVAAPLSWASLTKLTKLEFEECVIPCGELLTSLPASLQVVSIPGTVLPPGREAFRSWDIYASADGTPVLMRKRG